MKRFSLRTAVLATVAAGIVLGYFVREGSRKSNAERAERVMLEPLPLQDLELRAWKAATPGLGVGGAGGAAEERFATMQFERGGLSVTRTSESPVEQCMDYLHVNVEADYSGVTLNVIASRADVFAEYLKGLNEAARRENVNVRLREEGEYRTALAAP